MKLGILTYHAAYNYGSVLQAYATQCIVEKFSDNVEIINYRMPEQRRFYKLYRTKYGIKPFLKDLMQIPVHGKRSARCRAFEDFLNNYMRLSNECIMPQDVFKIWDQYDLIVSGSDQIWNKHSQELEHNSIEFMKPYLLSGYNGKKVSYASSIANMTDEELDLIIPDIKKFSHVSMRESSSAERMKTLLNIPVESVLDPTFLLTKEEWIKRLQLNKTNEDKYILYYSLLGIEPLKKNVAALRKIAEKRGFKVKVVNPFAYLNMNDKIVEMHPEAGPIDFLNAIYNAEMVVTNSYHGTILSVNFGKDVYSLCEHVGSEFRKTDILNRIGLSERIIYDVNKLLTKKYMTIDYSTVYHDLGKLRDISLTYLKKALV